MMRKLLEKSPRHKNKDASYDVLLDSYNSLAVSRNTLAHALWYSKEVTNTTYIEERPDGILSEMREFSEDEIDGILSGLIRLESMFAVFLEKAYSIPNKGAVIT